MGIDVGGTSIKAVLRGHDGTVLAEERRPTPAPDPTGLRVSDTVAAIASTLGHQWGQPVGVAVPGIVDEAHGIAVHSVNLGWNRVALRDALADRVGAGVIVSHDVRAGGVAEASTGSAGRGVTAFLAVGTGIAAAILLDGVPLSSGGWAGEIGQVVLADGPFAGQRLEQVASASATAARLGAPDARSVATAVLSGDAAAQAVWSTTTDVLGQALAMIVVTAAPTTVIVGGGLSHADDLLLKPLGRRLADLTPGLRQPRLLRAALGDTAAAHGAAILAQAAANPANTNRLTGAGHATT